MMEKVPGFRFYPTEEELLSFYLRTKLEEDSSTQRHDLHRTIDRVIPVLHIYAFNPSDLPKHSGEFCEQNTEQWFFFIPRQESEARGRRPNRLTTTGYWKATGSPAYVYSSKNRVIGLKRTMVFYSGRAPTGKKTDWKMNEYKAISQPSSNHAPPTLRQEYSLCRVYKSTKCLRAFDRRPMGPVEGDEATGVPASGDVNEDDDIGGTRTMASSAEATISSSSGDHGQTSEDNNYLDMEIEDGALWNWDQVNWFSGFV